MRFKHLICVSHKFSNVRIQSPLQGVYGISRFNIFIPLLYCLIACQVDPGPKKQPRFEKQIIDKSIKDTYRPLLDILFVIDDSASMGSEQDILAKNAELFISQFLDTKFIDYHIAVTTSSASSADVKSVAPAGKLNRCNELAKETKHNYSNYVDRQTPEAAPCLKEMMKVGEDGAAREHFFDIPLLVLSKKKLHKQNSKFYRSDAHLAVFIITDVEDQSGMTPEQSYQFLLKLKKGDERKIHYAAGIVIFDSDYCTREQASSFIPEKHMRMVSLFGSRGYYFNLCQFNYGKDLARFASHLIQSVLTVTLDNLPDVSSMRVHYEYENGVQKIPNDSTGWSYNAENNAIELSRNIHLEGEGGQFGIRYEPLHTPEYLNHPENRSSFHTESETFGSDGF